MFSFWFCFSGIFLFLEKIVQQKQHFQTTRIVQKALADWGIVCATVFYGVFGENGCVDVCEYIHTHIHTRWHIGGKSRRCNACIHFSFKQTTRTTMFGKICAPVKITHYYIDTREDILHIAILQISPRTQTVPIHTYLYIYIQTGKCKSIQEIYFH